MKQTFDVLVIYPEAIQKTLAGTGIRALELARSLARAGFRVGLTSTSMPNDRSDPDVSVFDTTKTELLRYASCSRLLLVQGSVLNAVPELCRLDVPVAVDLVCPGLLEALDSLNPTRSTPATDIVSRLLQILVNTRISLLRGDYFFCGSDKQRDWWLGHLAILGRLNHIAYPSIPDRFVIVPFGIPSTPPTRAKTSILREKFGDRVADAVIFYWGGGIWPWFDIRTAIEGFLKASRKSDSIRLLLPSLDPTVDRGLTTDSIELVKAAVKDNHNRILQFQHWIPYDVRAHILTEVDVGISCHPSSLESRFAVRTRCWDYLWAHLPMIVSDGDMFSSWVRQGNLGIVVAPGDADGWCNAILEMNSPDTRKKFSENVKEFAPTMTWERVAMPLVSFASNPSRLGDAAIPQLLQVPRVWSKGGHSRRRGLALIRFGLSVLFRHGPKQFLRGFIERCRTIGR